MKIEDVILVPHKLTHVYTITKIYESFDLIVTVLSVTCQLYEMWREKLHWTELSWIFLSLSDSSLTTDTKLRYLGLLPLKQKIMFNKLVLVFKAYINLAPPYLKQLFFLFQHSRHISIHNCPNLEQTF